MHIFEIKLRESTIHLPQIKNFSENTICPVKDYRQGHCQLNLNEWDTLLPSTKLDYNLSPLDATGYALFVLDIGWTPHSPLYTICRKPANDVPTINVLLTHWRFLLNDAVLAQEMV